MWGILVYQPWLPVNIRLLSPFLGVSAVVLPIYIILWVLFWVVKKIKFSIHAVLVGAVENECLFYVIICVLCFFNKDSFPPLDGGVKCLFGVRVESAAFRSPQGLCVCVCVHIVVVTLGKFWSFGKS